MINLVGKIFNKWTVLKDAPKDKWNKRTLLCKCECGTESIVGYSNLVRGGSKSCRPCADHKHGKIASHRLYRVWASMKSRCNNPNEFNYPNYGGRGITVCNSWLDFRGFIADMEDSYKEGLSLDRIDNNKGYFKENCRWTTSKEQSLNTRKAIQYKYKNQLVSQNTLTKILNVHKSVIVKKLQKGETIESIINEYEGN